MVASACHATQTQKHQQPEIVFDKGIWNFQWGFTGWSHLICQDTGMASHLSQEREDVRGRGHGSGKSQHIETFNKKCHAQNTKLSPQQPWKPEVKTPKVHQELGFFHQFHGCSHLIPLQEAAALLLPNQRNSKNLRKPQTCPFSYYITQSLLKRIILFHYFCLFVSRHQDILLLYWITVFLKVVW